MFTARFAPGATRGGFVSRWGAGALAIQCAILVGGCGSEHEGSKPGGDFQPVSQTATDGPVQLTITVARGDLPFSQRTQVVVEAVAQRDVTVKVVDYESILAEAQHEFEFELNLTRIDRRIAAPTDDGRLRWTYRYELKFYLPGEYELPPARLSFVAGRNGSGGTKSDEQSSAPVEAKELATEPLAIIARDTSEAPLEPEELREITTLPPVELPEPWSASWWIAAVVATVVVVVLWRFLRRSSLERAAIVVPAHEWARQQITALIHDDLIAAGRLQEFHYRLSDILRGYIERRYSVSAREMTTEEFLSATAGDVRFGERATAELNRFLIACDMVKYARYETHSSEAQALLGTVDEFVERTRERAPRRSEDDAPIDPHQERAA